MRYFATQCPKKLNRKEQLSKTAKMGKIEFYQSKYRVFKNILRQRFFFDFSLDSRNFLTAKDTLFWLNSPGIISMKIIPQIIAKTFKKN
jgi:hypothetical protein